jgi:branched-chain amino acid transport system ATP-binding protein
MLMVRDLQAGGDGCAALHGIGFAAEHSSITAIVGPGGAGKTTLANCICGSLPVIAGQVIFEDTDITRRPPFERVLRGMAWMPSGRRTFTEMSVLENLELGSAEFGNARTRSQLDLVIALFPELKRFLRTHADRLSPDLQRILMFARALMSAPRLLILDQPFYALSGEQTQKLTQVISQLNAEATSVLLLEQNLFQAAKLADTVYCMAKGRITAKHSALELLADRRVQSEFLRGSLQPAAEAIVL